MFVCSTTTSVCVKSDPTILTIRYDRGRLRFHSIVLIRKIQCQSMRLRADKILRYVIRSQDNTD